MPAVDAKWTNAEVSSDKDADLSAAFGLLFREIPYIRFWIFALSGNETRCDTHKRWLHEGVAKKCEAVACALAAVGQPILAQMYRDVGAGARVLGKSVAVTNGSPCARAKGRDAMEWYWAVPR